MRRRTAIHETPNGIDGLLATGMIGKNPAEHAEFVESATVETPELIESNTPRNSSPPANLGGLTWIAWYVQPSISANQVRDPESGRRGVARPTPPETGGS